MKGRKMSHQSSKPILLGVCVALLSASVPAYAVKNYKFSSFGGARQIWFEAEDFDERNPDNETYYPVVDAAGAFGKAITRAGGAGGMIRWTFDIRAAGGKGGTWYFWGRIINPGNSSDYMLVEGDPGDPTIPNGPPFPGGSGVAPFSDADDRIFEVDVPAPWAWGQGWDPEGHVKELRDGVNTMYIFHRQGNDTVFWDTFVWTDSPDYVPTDQDYQNATPVLPGGIVNPSPADEATDVPRDAVLSWTQAGPGETYDVYFGADFDVVSQATPTADPCGVYQGRIDVNSLAVERLVFGRTYSWRVDKVGAPPDTTAVKGSVWSFTAETFTSLVIGIIATASSSDPGAGPMNTVNNSGMTNDLHSTDNTAMWLSSATGPQPAWIQYELDGVYKLHEMRVWNYNVVFEPVLGYGFKDVTIEYSTDGTTWTLLQETQFVPATAQEDYAANTMVDFGGKAAKFVRLTAQSNWSTMDLKQYGLSEVQFFYIPAQPRQPRPASGATGVSVNAMLSWRAGREAASHKVYFSADQQAVAEGTAPAQTVPAPSFDPGPLMLGETYYWEVAEVNEAATPSVWEGGVWSFATQEYLVIDDFEAYNDDEGQGTRIYETWIDGYADGSSGSTVGYIQPPFAEQQIVHGGRQSMPLDYNNINTPFFSEAQRAWDTPQDWTAHGADTLLLYFRGNPIGFAETSPGSFTMSGGGTDIYNTTDEFRFAYQRLSANGIIMARVESIDNTDPWAKAGVMIRESLDPGARFAAVYATPGNGVRFQGRLLSASSATSDTPVATAEQMALQTPVWVKLERTSNSFSGFYSTDGVNWTPMSWNPQLLAMSGTVYIGMAVTSHNATATAVAGFSGVSVTGGTGGWEVQAIGVAQPANTPGPFYVAVQDSAGHLKALTHPDAQATLATTWQAWSIPLGDFSGVNLAAVKKLFIGVDSRQQPAQGAAGLLYIDDIGVGHPAN
jgi:hypothetical protein